MEDELARIGRAWMKPVELAKHEDLTEHMEHARFRESDLSVKGGAMLGFAGLMLAADLVFLSASRDSLIYPAGACASLGFVALYPLVLSSIFSLISIAFLSMHGSYQSVNAWFGLMRLYHDRRRWWLVASAVLSTSGTLIYLAAVTLVVLGRC